MSILKLLKNIFNIILNHNFFFDQVRVEPSINQQTKITCGTHLYKYKEQQKIDQLMINKQQGQENPKHYTQNKIRLPQFLSFPSLSAVLQSPPLISFTIQRLTLHHILSLSHIAVSASCQHLIPVKCKS